MLQGLRAGDVVGEKYQIRGLLGQGGMGTVYSVRHALTGKQFALKVLSAELARVPGAQQRLIREALAAGQIDHRYVVDIFDVGEDRSLVYLVMEQLKGKSLAKLLKERELPLRDALLIALRTMEGVAAAHAKNVIHRDLKPDNIYVCYGPTGQLDEPRVLDFGISKFALSSDMPTITDAGMMVGTPHYMCIEQLDGEEIDLRVDVYALGVILYEMLVGRPPFDGETMGRLSRAIHHATVMPISELRADVPEGLSEVVAKAMARRREDRYQSVTELLEALTPLARPILGDAALGVGRTLAPIETEPPDADTVVDLDLQAVFQRSHPPSSGLSVLPGEKPDVWDTSNLPVINLNTPHTPLARVHDRDQLLRGVHPNEPRPSLGPVRTSIRAQGSGYSPLAVGLVVVAVLLLGAVFAYVRRADDAPERPAVTPQERSAAEGPAPPATPSP